MKFIPITVVETKLPASFPQHEMLFFRENGSPVVYALPPLDVSYHYPPAVPWHWPWFCVDHAYCCQVSSCIRNIINGLAAYFMKTFCKRLSYEFDFSCKKILTNQLLKWHIYVIIVESLHGLKATLISVLH